MSSQRIIVGVDGSEDGERALRWAYGEAALRSAALEVVNAWDMPVVAFAGYVGPLDDDMEQAARATVERAVASLPAAGKGDVTIVPRIVQGHAAGTLVAASSGADLLVVGKRGAGGFAGLLLGSISQQVVVHARCPVAVIPAPDDASGESDLAAVERVVVGVDGSPSSRRAVQWAAEDAQRRGIPLVGVLAYGLLDQYGPKGPTEFRADYDESHAQAAVDGMLADAVNADAVTVEGKVVCGLPAPSLQESTGPSDLLVVGARGLGGFKGRLLGSVSQHIAQHATGPVVIVHEPAH